MAFYHWSTTAATNASADPTINFAEGQAPSSLNDSDRAKMARLKEWGNDISGTITTGGTSTAYTVTSNQVFDTLAHMNGAMVCFVPHATNGATVTLNVDGLGAKALRFSPSVELQSGVLILGTPYVATYINADSSWYLQGAMGNPYGMPLGGMMDYIGSTAPNSAFVLPFGQAISRTTYATLFALTSTTFGVGDGSTTFNVPDLRGRSTFGLDNMGGSAASRITVAGGNFDGTVLGQTGGGQNQTLTQAQLPAVALTFTGNAISANLNVPGGWSTGSPAQFGTTTVVAGGGTTIMTPGGGSGWSNVVTITATGTISNLGSGNSHPIMPPAMMLTKILRVI